LKARSRAAAIAFLAAIAAGGAQASPGLLLNADFEAGAVPGRACPASWSCSQHSDPHAFAFELSSGAGARGRFLKVTRVKPEPWAMAVQALPGADFAGKRLSLSVAVHGEALEGAAGPMIVLHGPGGRVLAHRKSLLKRGEGWRRATVEIEVVPGTERVECALIIEGGGSAGFDDVEAAVAPLAGA